MSALTRYKFRIRWMFRCDMPKVLSSESGTPHPLTEDEILAWLRQRNVIAMVAVMGVDKYDFDAGIVGHMVYALQNSSIEIVTFAVKSESRRQGVGTVMIQELKRKSSSRRRNRLIATVRESDVGLQLFLRSQGFECVRIEHGHFDGEDGYRMVYRLGAME